MISFRGFFGFLDKIFRCYQGLRDVKLVNLRGLVGTCLTGQVERGILLRKWILIDGLHTLGMNLVLSRGSLKPRRSERIARVELDPLPGRRGGGGINLRSKVRDTSRATLGVGRSSRGWLDRCFFRRIVGVNIRREHDQHSEVHCRVGRSAVGLR
jgi:hypothetical protein